MVGSENRGGGVILDRYFSVGRSLRPPQKGGPLDEEQPDEQNSIRILLVGIIALFFFPRKLDIFLLFDFLRPGSALDQLNFLCILCARCNKSVFKILTVKRRYFSLGRKQNPIFLKQGGPKSQFQKKSGYKNPALTTFLVLQYQNFVVITNWRDFRRRRKTYILGPY